jgi:hypothetical protein
MNSYTLTAAFTVAGQTLTRFVEFEDENDSDAAFTAIKVIMDNAIDDLVWASGSIRLTNADTGELVVEPMPQKV